MTPAPVWVVAGPPGSGKTTVSDLMLERLLPVPALLDKDTMYGPFVKATLTAFARDPGEREGPWYDEHVKPHEYAGMTATAREIRSRGCPVLLSGPFTGQIRDASRWTEWTASLGGPPVRLVWVRTDAATLRRRLEHRGSPRDTGKLADFDAFAARMLPETPPPVPHVAVDNRLTAPPRWRRSSTLSSSEAAQARSSGGSSRCCGMYGWGRPYGPGGGCGGCPYGPGWCWPGCAYGSGWAYWPGCAYGSGCAC